jgi:hypothetical protein
MQYCRHAIPLHGHPDYTDAREVWIQFRPHFEADVEFEDPFLGMLSEKIYLWENLFFFFFFFFCVCVLYFHYTQKI